MRGSFSVPLCLFFLFHYATLESSIEGPCRRWYKSCKNHKPEDKWVCTSVEDYIYYTINGCPSHPSHFKAPPPPPGRCLLVNDTCQFDSSSTLQCAYRQSLTDLCRYKCLAVNGSSGKDNCTYNRYPNPDTVCIPMNGKCQEYSPCKYWEELPSPSFRCGTIDDYYKFKFGPKMLQMKHSQIPPGDCILQYNSCSWSNCTMHKDICEHAWMCDSAYDAAVYYAQPPPSCPNPAPGTTPPPIPGKCIFNLIASKCQFTGKG